jgi:hypothetical protein
MDSDIWSTNSLYIYDNTKYYYVGKTDHLLKANTLVYPDFNGYYGYLVGA